MNEAPEDVNTVLNQARDLREQQKDAEAEEVCRQALAIRRKALGMEHPDCAALLLELSDCLCAQGKYDEAQRHAQQALTIYRKQLGEEHALTALAYHTLARHLQAQGKYALAVEGYRNALAIRGKVLGEKHPATTTSRDSLADVLIDQGSRAEAAALRPLLEVRWGVEHVAGRDGQVLSRATLARSAHLGDHLSCVEAVLDSAAYAYLIAYRPDGQEDLCWPQRDDQAPPRSKRACYPPPGQAGVDYGLTDGVGWQAFVVVASRRPLPPYRDWVNRHGKPTWSQMVHVPLLEATEGEAHAWCDEGTGLQPLASLDLAQSLLLAKRGMGEPRLAPAPLAALGEWWRKAGVETVGLIGFPVLPAESKDVQATPTSARKERP